MSFLHPPSCRKVLLGELTEKDGTFHLRGKRITHVDIIGTVMNIVEKSQHTVMEVDDNTAAIQCMTFNTNKEQSDKKTDSVAKDEDEAEDLAKPTGLAQCLWQNYETQETPEAFLKRLAGRQRRPVRRGDLVNVTGRLGVFCNRWQIITSSVAHVDDCNAEWFRVREIEAQRKALKE